MAQAAVEAGCKSVAFTYNDPVIFAEYAIDAAHACRERGIKTVAVTAGYLGEAAREDFFEAMDAVNVDLKAFNEQFYRKLCFAELGPVKETLEYVAKRTDVWLEVTTLLIPGQNDSESEVRSLCEWMLEELGPDVPLHFSAFHPDFRMLGTPRTPPATCKRARDQARAIGIHHVYSGNIVDPSGQSTYCPACGECVIERDGYRIGGYRVSGNACDHCGERIVGVFSDEGPGHWGSRRARVLIG